jgi:hypothetical protein
MQNYHDDVPNGTCELSDSVIGTANLSPTATVTVTPAPEPGSCGFLAICLAAMVLGRVRRKRRPL